MRQNAGRSLYAPLEFGPRPPGRFKAPASTGCTKVIVVFGRAREARFSQVTAPAGRAHTELRTMAMVDFLTSTTAASRSLAAIISQGFRSLSLQVAWRKQLSLRAEPKTF